METSLVHSSPSPRADRPASSLADNSQGTAQPGGWGLVEAGRAEGKLHGNPQSTS